MTTYRGKNTYRDENTKMYHNAKMYDSSKMFGESEIQDNAKMYDKSRMCNNSMMTEDAILRNNQTLKDHMTLHCEAKDVMYFSDFNRLSRSVTAILPIDSEEWVFNIGCKIGITKCGKGEINMKKSDLQTGMWVETRNGEMFLVIKGEIETLHYGIQSTIFVRENAFDIGDNYNENLICKFGTKIDDIIKVYGNIDGNIVNSATYTFNKSDYDCIWERKEKVPFNLEDYKGKYVMCCNTEEEAEEFCKFLYYKGRKWARGDSYFNLSYWEHYRENTAYYFNEGLHTPKICAEEHGYQMLNFDNFTFDIPKYKDVPKDTKQGTIIEVSNDNKMWYKRKFVAFVDGTLIAETPNVAKVKIFKYGRIKNIEKEK